jgi:hypothetical protein
MVENGLDKAMVVAAGAASCAHEMEEGIRRNPGLVKEVKDRLMAHVFAALKTFDQVCEKAYRAMEARTREGGQ